jgi:drug/metabolite transporter (DMT)-like permease
MKPRRTLLIASFVAVCVVWGSTYLAIRVALEGFPPFLLGAVRFLFAGAVLFAYARSRGEAAPTRAQWGSALLTGSLLFVIGNGLVNFAEQSVSSGLASVLVATMPLWATLFGRLFGASVSGREVAGIVLGLAGVAVLNLGGDLRASPVGAMCCLAAPMGWALGSMASRRLPMPPGVMMRTASQMLGGGAATAVVSLLAGEHLPSVPSFRAVAAVLYLVTFGSLVGFSAYSYLLAHTRTAVATSYAYVNPVIAVVLGVVVAHEHFGLTSVVGGAIVLAAVVLVGLGRRPAQSLASPSRSRSIVAVGSDSAPNSSTTPSSPTTT